MLFWCFENTASKKLVRFVFLPMTGYVNTEVEKSKIVFTKLLESNNKNKLLCPFDLVPNAWLLSVLAFQYKVEYEHNSSLKMLQFYYSDLNLKS